MNNTYKEFISLTENLLNELTKEGYTITSVIDYEVDYPIFRIKSPTDSRYGKKVEISTCIQSMQDTLLYDKPFLLLGDFTYNLKTKWIKGLCDLNPTPLEIKNIYQACFQDLGLETITHILNPSEYKILLTMMHAKQLPPNDLGKGYLRTGLLHAISKIKDNWNFINKDELLPAMHAFLTNNQSILGTLGKYNQKDIDEVIMSHLKNIFPQNYLDFLPYFPKLPQKTILKKENVDIFDTNEKALANCNIINQYIYDTYPSIINYDNLKEMVEHAMGLINELVPHNINKVMVSPTNKENSTHLNLIVESKDVNAPDMKLFKHMLLKLCDMYVQDDNKHKFDYYYWETATHSIYMDYELPSSTSKVPKRKI